MRHEGMPQLVCPAGNLPALQAAVAHGADAVYLGLPNATNARHFPGLNFSLDEARRGISHARKHGVAAYLAINTYAQPGQEADWRAAVDSAADLGASAIIVADMGVMAYAARVHPDLPRHVSVQAASANAPALTFLHEQFGVQRAVLPRVLHLRQVEQVIQHTPLSIEVFGFGSLCVMLEGRCSLSSWVTGQSPNTHGVCSPAHAVSWVERQQTLESRLGPVLIDRYAPQEPAGYPTLCKGRFEVDGRVDYAFEEPVSLNVLPMLPQLMQMGVAAIKVEGRQRHASYVATVTRALRQALDACHAAPQRFQPRPEWLAALGGVAEGQHVTLGAYQRSWK